jgi:hypothetical protein
MLLNKTFFGEAQHPGDDRNEVWASAASHNITKMWLNEEESSLMGRIDVLDTPAGRTIKTLIDYGSTLGVSARAEGMVESTPQGEEVQIDGYDFRCFDFVTCPGFSEARVSLTESVKSMKAFTAKVKEAVESETLTEETGRALRSIIKSSDNKELKDFLPKLEERLSKVSNDASRKLREQIEKATELQGQVKVLTEELDHSRRRVQSALKTVNSLKEALTTTRRDFGRTVLAKDKKIARLQERVDLMIGNIQKYRSKDYKPPRIIEGIQSVSTVEVSREAKSETVEDRRLGGVLKRSPRSR